MGPLREQLAERKALADAYVRAETQAVHARVVRQLRDSGILNRVLPVGSPTPSFGLEDQNGSTVSSHELLQSGRLIVITRRLLGGFDVADVRWQDLEEVALRVGVFGADLAIRAGKTTDLASEGAHGSRRLEFQGLRKEQAQAVYRICQAQDQAWREKRRIRELEELRARSGGIQVLSGQGAPGSAQSEAVRRLQEAKQLLDAKLITDAEYEAIKAKIVSF